MLLNVVILIFLAMILYALGSGLYYLVRKGHKEHQARQLVYALTWRIILSLCLFVMIMLAYFLGWMKPHAIILLN